MALFSVVNDAFVVLRSRGVFRQSKVFQRDGRLYAGYGNGFVQLRRDNATSVPTMTWDYIEGVQWVRQPGSASQLVVYVSKDQAKAA
jgi:hypothetical protein